MKIRHLLITLIICQSLFAFQSALAVDSQQTFNVNQTIGDGQKGRTFGKWTQGISNTPVQLIDITLRKTKGGSDAYVNLRFQGGQTFENGKRVHLGNAQSQTVRWNLNGQSSNGQPLVLNAYNAEVYVEAARVVYQAPAAPPAPVAPPAAQYPGSQAPFSGSSASAQTPNPQVVQSCRSISYIQRPKIQVSKTKPTGGLFSGKHRVYGSIRGLCIAEAGYYENGQLKESIDIPLTDSYSRHPFEVKIRTGHGGTIEVFTVTGTESTIEVDELVSNN